MQFAVGPELRQPVANEALVTEASGSDRIQALNRVLQVLSAREIVDGKLNVGSGRYRSRFCNDSPTLANGLTSGMKLHQYLLA